VSWPSGIKIIPIGIITCRRTTGWTGAREADFVRFPQCFARAWSSQALNVEDSCLSPQRLTSPIKRAQSLPMQDENRQIDLNSITGTLRQQLPSLAERYRVKSLGVFGSYVHRQQHAESDIDLLVVFDEPPSLLKFIELENYLTDLLGVRVDLVMKDALKPAIGKRILSEVVQI
jgi:uncharacterized protein